jgi:hypothetical protein
MAANQFESGVEFCKREDRQALRFAFISRAFEKRKRGAR